MARNALRKERRNTSLKKTVTLNESASEHDTPIKLPSIKLKKELEGGLLQTAPRPPRVKGKQPIVYGGVDVSTSAHSNLEYSDKYSVQAHSVDRRANRQRSLKTLQRTLGDPVELPASLKARANTLERVKFFDLLEQISNGNIDESEMNENYNFVMSISKVLKAMFQKYSVISPAKRGSQLSKVTFEDMKKEHLTMDLAEINAFLNDFKIMQ